MSIYALIFMLCCRKIPRTRNLVTQEITVLVQFNYAFLIYYQPDLTFASEKNVAYDERGYVNYVKAWAWHRHHEKYPREKEDRILQGNIAYASAARRRTYGGGDGDGGPGVSLSPRTHLRRCFRIRLQPSHRR